MEAYGRVLRDEAVALFRKAQATGTLTLPAWWPLNGSDLESAWRAHCESAGIAYLVTRVESRP